MDSVRPNVTVCQSCSIKVKLNLISWKSEHSLVLYKECLIVVNMSIDVYVYCYLKGQGFISVTETLLNVSMSFGYQLFATE